MDWYFQWKTYLYMHVNIFTCIKLERHYYISLIYCENIDCFNISVFRFTKSLHDCAHRDREEA